VFINPLPASEMPDPVLRPITLDDLEAVRLIDRDAFATYRRQHHQLTRPLLLRTLDNMQAAIERPHAGIVLEWPPGHIVGYCFTHVWGSLGWLGTLGVSPRSQGFGLGQRVIAGGLDLLRSAGCQILALETMPESGKNLALYTRLGLEARYLTMLCQGAVKAAPSTHFEIWSGGDELRLIASQLLPGLDPSPAARWLLSEAGGETLIWHEHNQPVAFAILRAAPRRLEGFQTVLTLEAAGCLPAAAYHWPRYLSEMQAYARTQNKSGLALPVNARQTDLLRTTLEAGYQIIHTRVRMAIGDFIGSPDAILMLTLAM